MDVSVYLYNILGIYFQNRVLVYVTEVPQVSISCPVLWNVMFGEVLRLEFPVEMEIVGFADDIMLEVYGESIEEVELITAYSNKVVEARRDPGNWNWLTKKLRWWL